MYIIIHVTYDIRCKNIGQNSQNQSVQRIVKQINESRDAYIIRLLDQTNAFVFNLSSSATNNSDQILESHRSEMKKKAQFNGTTKLKNRNIRSSRLYSYLCTLYICCLFITHLRALCFRFWQNSLALPNTIND